MGPFQRITICAILIFTYSFQLTGQDTTYLFPMRKNLQWGYIDRQGEWVIEPQYDFVTPFTEGLARVYTEENHWQFINTEGDTAFGNSWYRKGHNGKRPYGKTIPLDAVDPFSEGLAPVIEGSYYGSGEVIYIDKQGNTVIQEDFSSAYPFSDGLARAEKDDKIGYINKKGEWVIEPQFERARDFSEGRAAVRKEWAGDWGFIDKSGTLIIPCQYEKVGPFSEGYAYVQKKVEYGNNSDYLYGFINRNGEEVVSPKYEGARSFSEGYAAVANDDGDWGYLNRSFHKMIPFWFEDAGPFSEGLAVVRRNDENFYINPSGNRVIERPEFKRADHMGTFRNGLAPVVLHMEREVHFIDIDPVDFLNLCSTCYLGWLNKEGEWVARQSKAEQQYIQSRIDSVEKAKKAAERRERQRKLEAERQRLKDCPGYLSYGDSTRSNWLEFNILNKKRKLYFEKVVVRKDTQSDRYLLYFPPFGLTPEDRALENQKIKGFFAGLARNIMDDLSRFVIEINPQASFKSDRLRFKKHRLLYLDCMEKIEEERFDRIFEDHSSDRHFAIQEPGGDQKAWTITFISRSEQDSNNYIRGHIRSDDLQFIEQEEGTWDEKIEAWLKGAEDEQRSGIRHQRDAMYYYPRLNTIRYKGHSLSGSQLPTPEGGKDYVVRTGEHSVTIYEYKALSERFIFVNRYVVEPGQDRSADHPIFKRPLIQPKPKSPESYRLDTSTLVEQIYSTDVVKLDVAPLFIPRWEEPGQDQKEQEPQMEELAFNRLSGSDPVDFKKKASYDGYFMNLNGRDFYTVKGRPAEAGDDSLVVYPKGGQVLEFVRFRSKQIKEALGEEAYEQLITFFEKTQKKRRAWRMQEESPEEAVKKQWFEQHLEQLDILEIKEQERALDYMKQVQEQLDQRFGSGTTEMLVMFGDEERVEQVAALREFYDKLLRIARKYESDTAAFRKAALPVVKSYGYEWPQGCGNAKRCFNALEEQVEERYNEQTLELAGQMRKMSRGSIHTIRLGENGYPEQRTFELSNRYGSTMKGKVVYGKDRLHLYAKAGEVKDTMHIPVAQQVLDLHQFESMLPWLKLNKRFEAQWNLFAMNPGMTMSYSTGKGGSSSSYLEPVCVRANVKVTDKVKLKIAREKYKLYKVKVTFDGDVSELPSVYGYENLQYDPSTKKGYLVYYVDKKSPHWIRKVTADEDQTVIGYTRVNK